MTPFACAMTHKNNKAAEAILKREPGAAEQVALTLYSFPFMKGQLWCYSLMIQITVCVQVDNKGRNFLHVAVQNSDIESVLFLISVQANVNSRVQDAAKLTPLHLAVQTGSEIIVRNLVRSDLLILLSSLFIVILKKDYNQLCFSSLSQLLAGAKVNELTKHRQTALHLAAQQDLATICSVLLENGVDFAAEDENGSNGNFNVLFIYLFKNQCLFWWAVQKSVSDNVRPSYV